MQKKKIYIYVYTVYIHIYIHRWESYFKKVTSVDLFR
jgi:hypothetical protein